MSPQSTKLFATVIMATLLAASPAMARDQHGQRDTLGEYNEKMSNPSGAQNQGNAMTQKASPYPCTRCVYDQKAGGWVEVPHLNR